MSMKDFFGPKWTPEKVEKYAERITRESLYIALRHGGTQQYEALIFDLIKELGKAYSAIEELDDLAVSRKREIEELEREVANLELELDESNIITDEQIYALNELEENGGIYRLLHYKDLVEDLGLNNSRFDTVGGVMEFKKVMQNAGL